MALIYENMYAQFGRECAPALAGSPPGPDRPRKCRGSSFYFPSPRTFTPLCEKWCSGQPPIKKAVADLYLRGARPGRVATWSCGCRGGGHQQYRTHAARPTRTAPYWQRRLQSLGIPSGAAVIMSSAQLIMTGYNSGCSALCWKGFKQMDGCRADRHVRMA